MNYMPWIGLGLWLAGIAVQIGVGRWNNRISALEEWRKMLEKDHPVEVRLQLIEQKHTIKERRQWPR